MASHAVTKSWWDQHLGMPYWRTGSPGTRFGMWGYDCSGGTTEATIDAQHASGLFIPTNSADAARWAMKTGRAYGIRNARQAKPFDLVIYDKYGVPQDGYGPRGHIGEVHEDGIHTWESAGSTGVSVHDRGNFWQLAVDMSDLFTATPAPAPKPQPLPEDEMYLLMKGDVYDDVWFTNLLTKRHIGSHPGHDKAAQDEAAAILNSGATNGKKTVTWPQAFVNAIAEVH